LNSFGDFAIFYRIPRFFNPNICRGWQHPLGTTGLDSKKEQQQELPVPETGASKEANIDNSEIPPGGDYFYPFTVSMALLQDFTLTGLQMYNELAREFSKISGYWLNILWNAWGEGSESDKKSENE
jgi:hypothetical protein